MGVLLLITIELQPDTFCRSHLFAVEHRADVFLCKEMCSNTLHYYSRTFQHYLFTLFLTGSKHE